MDKYGADHPDAMQAEKVYISAVGNYNQQYSQDQGSGSAEWVPE